MRRLLFAFIAIAAFDVSPGVAADLPAKAPTVAPVAANWTGFYAGVSGGWANMTTRISLVDPGGIASPVFRDSGAILGGTIGYNWQQPSWVFGVEADLSWTDLKARLTGFCSAPGCVTELNGLGTVRGRAGYLATPSILLYGTGGLAIGNVNFNHKTVPVTNFDSTYTKLGWTLGGGVEAQLWRNWSAKVEYLYFNLGASDVITTALGAQHVREDYVRGNIVRLGLNYHFGAL